MCVRVSQEQGEGQNGAVGLKQAQNQLPFYLSRGAQDPPVIKAGYCVKQGAVVRTQNIYTHTQMHTHIGKPLYKQFYLSSTDEELEEAVLPVG